MKKSEKPNRRNMFQNVLAGTATGMVLGLPQIANGQQQEDEDGDKILTDAECIMQAGMTEDEADCWEKIAEAAGAFFALPELHPLDKAEVATAVHVIQNKLLGRPTYRKYLEIAKPNYEKRKKLEESKKDNG